MLMFYTQLKQTFTIVVGKPWSFVNGSFEDIALVIKGQKLAVMKESWISHLMRMIFNFFFFLELMALLYAGSVLWNKWWSIEQVDKCFIWKVFIFTD